jgi:hypothetical protein
MWLAHLDSIPDHADRDAGLLPDGPTHRRRDVPMRATVANSGPTRRDVARRERLPAAAGDNRDPNPRSVRSDHFAEGALPRPSHLVTTVRNLVTLLVRLGHHRVAALLLGAVTDAPAPPSFGPEAERLDAAAEECRRALGNQEFERMLARGRARPLDDGVAAARTALLATT